MRTEDLLAAGKQLRADLNRLAEIAHRAKDEGRSLSRRELAEVRELRERADRIHAQLPSTSANVGPRAQYDAPLTDTEAKPPVLRRGDKFIDYVREHEPQHFRSGLWDELLDPSRFSLGRMARGMVTGEWRGAETERRAMLEGTSSAGGALLPTPMSGTLIDRLRNIARTQQAGASTVIMTEQILFMGRLTSGPTPALAWHSEGQQINTADRTVDKLTFTAKTLPNLTLISYELLNDMTDEAAQTIENEIVKSLALEIDRVCLRGSGVGPEPLGIVNQPGVTLTSLGANGALPLWDNIVDAVSVLRSANVDPNALLWSARTQQTIDKYKSSIGEYLQPPPGIAEVARLVSNQIPDNLAHGTSTASSEIYVGQWEHLLLGVRQNIGFELLGATGPALGGRVRVLQERYADQGLAGLLCFFRGDVQLAHPQAFNVLQGVTTS